MVRVELETLKGAKIKNRINANEELPIAESTFQVHGTSPLTMNITKPCHQEGCKWFNSPDIGQKDSPQMGKQTYSPNNRAN